MAHVTSFMQKLLQYTENDLHDVTIDLLNILLFLEDICSRLHYSQMIMMHDIWFHGIECPLYWLLKIR